MNRERLLNVARALRESPNPDLFTMLQFAHPCRTPACALGHYAARTDLQQAFELREVKSQYPDSPFRVLLQSVAGGRWLDLDGPEVCEHFDIDHFDAAALFGGDGCGCAKTANEAAEYIERTVAAGEVPHA